jgi:hypothetical protein
MSCWVVPSVAAELWGTSIEHVMECIRDGRVVMKQEHGFTLVDVAPHSPTIEKPRMRKEDRPPTYVELTAEELVALHSDQEDHVETTQEDDGESLGDWRAARLAASRGRRRPAAALVTAG